MKGGKKKLKKILLFSDKWGNGGIESFVMNVIRCLDNTKYNITLVCAKKLTDLYDDELKEKNIKTIELLSKGGNSPGMRRIEALKRFKALIANNNFYIAHFNICNSVDMFYAYISKKNKRNNPDRLELKKYCPREKRMTLHKETK